MSIDTPLFVSQNLYLRSVDAEATAPVFARWTEDLDFAAGFSSLPPTPLRVDEMKKRLEEMVKEAAHEGTSYFFTVHLKADDAIIGYIHIKWILWNTGIGQVKLELPEANSMEKYGLEALRLALQFVFDELNLYRIAMMFSEHREDLRALAEAAGMQLEVRQRSRYFRHGRYWDVLMYGILEEEWLATTLEVNP